MSVKTEAPAALNAALAIRLTKLLGLLGSDHAGERATAGLKADELVRNLGLTWHDIIVPSAAQIADQDWRRMAAFCFRHRERLTNKQREFVAGMVAWRRPPSDKQAQWLVDIFSKLHE